MYILQKLYIYIHKQYGVQLLQINSYTVFNFHPMFSNLEMLLYEAAVPHLASVSATRQCLVGTNNFTLDNGAGSNHNIWGLLMSGTMCMHIRLVPWCLWYSGLIGWLKFCREVETGSNNSCRPPTAQTESAMQIANTVNNYLAATHNLWNTHFLCCIILKISQEWVKQLLMLCPMLMYVILIYQELRMLFSVILFIAKWLRR